jgi:type I restriction enzyme S subunit
MRSNYKQIGDFIELVDERNKNLSINLLLGLSISKVFIPSVANIIGTDMAKYKIIRKGQFACSIMQVRRDGKMPIALLRDFDEAIISQAYPVFQVKDENEILPEYLMMWFSRSEFDRHACFLAVGGVRGSLEWEDFLEMELPIPSIEKQREIVAEYNTVVNRIKLNEQLNQKLEETVQALYKHWFVDFEFPSETLAKDGVPQPYKSSGGKMVFNEELDKEIPHGWILKNVNDAVRLGRGASPRPIVDYISNSGKPWVKIADATKSFNKFLLGTKEFIINDGVSKSRLLKPGTLILANSGSLGTFIILEIEACAHDGWHIFHEWKLVSRQFMTQFLQANNEDILSSAYGSVFTNLKLDFLKDYPILIPCDEELNLFTDNVKIIERRQLTIAREVELISRLKDLVLAKMTKLEQEEMAE